MKPNVAVITFVFCVFGASGICGPPKPYPDYSRASSPDCADYLTPPSCAACQAGKNKTYLDKVKEMSQPAWKLNFATQMRKKFLLKLAAVFQQQAAINGLIGGKKIGSGPSCKNCLGPSQFTFDDLQKSCDGCDPKEQKFIGTLFGVAEKNGEKQAATWLSHGRDASELYQKRLALALADKALIQARLGLAKPSFDKKDLAELKPLDDFYPAVTTSESVQLGEEIIKSVIPSHVTPKFADSDSYGNDATAMKFMANEDDDDIAPAMNKFLFPTDQKDGGEPRLPKNFESDTWKSETFYQIMKKPLSSEILGIVRQAQRDYLLHSLNAAKDLCSLDACGLANLDAATTAGFVASSGGNDTLDKMFLCTSCATDDKTAWGKFKNTYLNIVLTAASMGATVACLAAPPYPCYVSVGLSAVSVARNNPFAAYADYQKKMNFLSTGLVTPETASAAFAKLQYTALQSALSVISLAAGTLDLVDVVAQFKNVEDAGKIIATVNPFDIPRELRGFRDGDQLAEDMVAAAGHNPKLREELVKLGEAVDRASNPTLVVRAFLKTHADEIERVVALHEHAGQATIGTAYDLTLSTINLASQTEELLDYSKKKDQK